MLKDFHDLDVWKRAHELTLRVYEISNDFPGSEDYGLTSQIRRSISSIPSNIAEGCGAWGDGELGRYLKIALRSSSEAEYQLELARDLNYLPSKKFENLRSELDTVKKMLVSFIQKVQD